VLDVGLTGEAEFADGAAEIEAMFAPAAEDDFVPVASLYQFDGALSDIAAGAIHHGSILGDSGTMQMRVELDPGQRIAPVTQVTATIRITCTVAELSGNATCSSEWESRQLQESSWDDQESLNFPGGGQGRVVLHVGRDGKQVGERRSHMVPSIHS
jgi:hypothetical protein